MLSVSPSPTVALILTPSLFVSLKLCSIATLQISDTARWPYTNFPQRNFCCCREDCRGQSPSCGTIASPIIPVYTLLCQLSDFCCSPLCQFWPPSSLSSSLLQWCEIADLRLFFFWQSYCCMSVRFRSHLLFFCILCLCAPKAQLLMLALLNKLCPLKSHAWVELKTWCSNTIAVKVKVIQVKLINIQEH